MSTECFRRARRAPNADKQIPPSFNGKPKATVFRYAQSRLRLAVKRPGFSVIDDSKMLYGVVRPGVVGKARHRAHPEALA